MDLIVIIGSGAVGKMTVGQQLREITDFRLFHNHMMIEPVIEIFGNYDGAAVSRLRDVVFEEFMRTDFQGMIFTYMWAFDLQSDWDYIAKVAKRFEDTGGTVYYVELVADQAVRLQRNRTENRLLNKASKRNIAVSDDRMIREETKYRLVSNEGEIPFPNYIKIDNTNLEPDEVARMIKKHFSLPGPKSALLMKQTKIEEAGEDELSLLHSMQIESFRPLYEKYRDEGSPALESLDRIRARAAQPGRKYYFVVWNGARVGAINIADRSTESEKIFYVSPLFILPRYQNRGLGFAALQHAFALHPEADAWRLDTIAQEKGNCHLYEKCGFVRTGGEHVINDAMTLVDYELRK